MKEKKLHIVEIYNNIKEKHKNKVVLFQIGAFYEILGDDVKKISKTIGIKEASRKFNDSAIPMCGFPVKKKHEYVKLFMLNKIPIVIIDEKQSIDRETGKKFIERELSDVITNSVSHLNDEYSVSLLNSYVASIDKIGNNVTILFVDISTGDAFIEYTRCHKYDIIAKLKIYESSEIVIPDTFQIDLSSDTLNITTIADKDVNHSSDITSINGIKSITNSEKILIHRLITYIYDIKRNIKFYINGVYKRYNYHKIYIPSSTLTSLLIIGNKESDISLYSILDNTITPMGRRGLRNILVNPVNSDIKTRHKIIDLFYKNSLITGRIKECLSNISDTERIAFRVINNNSSINENGLIIKSFLNIVEIYKILSNAQEISKFCSKYEKECKELEDFLQITEFSVNDNEIEIPKSSVSKISEFIKNNISLISIMSTFTGYVDALLSTTKLFLEKKWVKPEIVNENIIEITDGYHPIYEYIEGGKVVKNDFNSSTGNNIAIITGPNMSGKSIYMKQVALICFLAQIGFYVPCSSMKVGKLDAIITRIGSNDDLLNSKSTFFVEMEEIADIVYHASEKSLCIIDELGRGTNIEEGVQISTKILSYLAEYNKPHIICSTHIHSLTSLANNYKQIKNYNFQAKINSENEIIFDYKIQKGSSNSTAFSKYIAKMLKLPKFIWED